MSLRYLLVDDNVAFLETARLLLRQEGVTVVGTATNKAEALQQARALQPDVALVDITLADESGFDLAWMLSRDKQSSDVDVILISVRAETDYADLIADSPAVGFVAKSDLSKKVIDRILGHPPNRCRSR
ncbi:MAG: putative transcriptional regulator [Frankiales bacterium]|nr:putative transcriptional regulator [Frankiales bacterium]